MMTLCIVVSSNDARAFILDALGFHNDTPDIIKRQAMLTGFQIRAARAGLRITAKELADRAGVSLPTIQRFETVDGVPPSRSTTLLGVKTALESAGIEFIGTPQDGPGIRLRAHNAGSK